MSAANVLIISNTDEVISGIQAVLASTVYSTHIARDANSAEGFLTASKPEIVLVESDVKQSDDEPFYAEIHTYSPSSEVILLCNLENMKLASELVHQNAAYDYLVVNPFNDSYRLPIMIERALEKRELTMKSKPLDPAPKNSKENSDPQSDVLSGRVMKDGFAQGEKIEDSILDPTAMAAMELELTDSAGEKFKTQPSATKGRGKGKSVLVIEDDEVTVIFIECVLTGMDYAILKADTALKGIEIARQKQPDLILLDVMLPEMNGTEVLRKLKKNLLTERIPVIMMTSLSDKAVVNQCIEEQCDDYIVKPLTKKVLEEKVRRLINSDRKNLAGL